MILSSQLQYLLLLVNSVWQKQQCPLTWQYLYPNNQLWEVLDINFDFIIVGAGTAGSVLANRLSEVSEWNVLLIEAGGTPSNLTEVPSLFLGLQQTREDWSFSSQRQKFACKAYKDERCNFAQGKVLGGSSSINVMVYSPGVPWDYDNWAAQGNEGWSWNSVKPYFDKLNAYLSDQGYVRSTYYESTLPARSLLVAACNELGIPVNSGKPIGYKDVNVTVDGGQRFSMAKAYLSPIRNRPNLKVLMNTLVTKVAIENQRAVGVEIMTDFGPIVIKAKKEVVVTAGAINSPKLLMLSGIGPADHLISKGIPVKKNLPVGSNMQDHLAVPIMIQLPEVDLSANYTQLFELYCASRVGLNDSQIANFQGFISTNGETDHPNIELFNLLFPKNDSIMFEALLTKLGYNPVSAASARKLNAESPSFFIMPTILHPESTGYVRLQDADPLSDPLIYPEYLTKDQDLKTMIDGLDFVFNKVLKTEAFKGAVIANVETPNCKHLPFNTSPYWLCYIFNYATTFWHFSVTCRMGPVNENAVVDNRLRVHGIKGLRVSDSSAVPDQISGHLNIPVCMLAEKASDLIKEDNGVEIERDCRNDLDTYFHLMKN